MYFSFVMLSYFKMSHFAYRIVDSLFFFFFIEDGLFRYCITLKLSVMTCVTIYNTSV